MRLGDFFMSSSLDFAGLVVAAVRLARQYDPDAAANAAHYDKLINDLESAMEGAKLQDAYTEIFIDDLCPTYHITKILNGLGRAGMPSDEVKA